MEIAMNCILYFVIFITGSVFGSFFSLAIYRLPRKENITYVRSHCTSCEHPLHFWDLIPIWSYLFLGGKCRYCGEKIRARYILLEIFSGIVFVLTAAFNQISAYSSITELMHLFLLYLFFCAIFIIGGIDNEKKIIHNGTLLYGMIISILYILFMAIFFQESAKYHLIGFLVIPFIMLFISVLLKRMIDTERLPWGFGDIKYIALIGLFVGFGMQVLICCTAVILAATVTLVKKYKIIPFGYFLSIATVIGIILYPQIVWLVDLLNMTLI